MPVRPFTDFHLAETPPAKNGTASADWNVLRTRKRHSKKEY